VSHAGSVLGFVCGSSKYVSLNGKWPSWLLPGTALFVQNYFVDETRRCFRMLSMKEGSLMTSELSFKLPISYVILNLHIQI
jgi:hypothetical protein